MNWEIHKSWKHDLHVYMCTTALVTPLSAGKNWKKDWQRKGDILWREKLDGVMQRSLVGKHWERGWGIGRCTNTYQLNLRQMIRIWSLKSSKWRNCLKIRLHCHWLSTIPKKYSSTFLTFCGLFNSSCKWRWKMWSDRIHKERRMSSSALHWSSAHLPKWKEG